MQESHIIETISIRSRTESETSGIEYCIIDIPDEHASHEATAESHTCCAQRHASNIKNIVLRNTLSVGMLTALRQYLRIELFPYLISKSPHVVAPVLGATSLAIPIALQLAGLARDYHNGTQTRETLCSRVTLIMIEAITAAALVATGGLAATTPALMATLFGYVFPRDTIQYFLKLSSNNNSGLNFKATAISATAYGINQTGVGFFTKMVVEKLRPIFGDVYADMISCAAINEIGETLDEYVNHTAKAHVENNPALQINLRKRSHQDASVADTLLNTASSRGSLFTSAYAASSAANLDGLKGDILVGVLLALEYIPFFYTHAQKARPADSDTDIELGTLPA